MADLVVKPIYLVPSLGEYAVAPDGAILNIGGTASPVFTVDGKPLLFADGSATDGSLGISIRPSLQNVYENSDTAVITLWEDKPLTFAATNGNAFTIDANTGDVTVDGLVNGKAVGDVRGFEYVQSTPSDSWNVQHNSNSRKAQVSIWDEDDEMVYADTVSITNANSVLITFNTPISGRAIVMLF